MATGCQESYTRFDVGDIIESVTGNHWEVMTDGMIKCVKALNIDGGKWKFGDIICRENHDDYYRLVHHGLNYLPYLKYFEFTYSSDRRRSPYYSSNTTKIKMLNNFIKKLTDAKVQELIKAGYVNGDLKPTTRGLEKLDEILFFANYESLVTEATNENKEREEKNK